jgi:hypothetical protein
MGLNLYPDFYRTNSGDDGDLLNFEVLELAEPSSILGCLPSTSASASISILSTPRRAMTFSG